MAQGQLKFFLHWRLWLRKLQVHVRGIPGPSARAVGPQLLKIDVPSAVFVVFGESPEPTSLQVPPADNSLASSVRIHQILTRVADPSSRDRHRLLLIGHLDPA